MVQEEIKHKLLSLIQDHIQNEKEIESDMKDTLFQHIRMIIGEVFESNVNEDIMIERTKNIGKLLNKDLE